MIRARRVPALVAVLALAAAGLTLTPVTEAQADDYCDYEDTVLPVVTDFAPSTVTLGLNSKLVTFSVQASDDCGVMGWYARTPDKLLFSVYDGDPKETMYSYDNDDAGLTAVDVSVYDTNFNSETTRFTFRLLRQTRWKGLDVAPEPVRAGKKVRIRATLQRVDWDKDRYRPYGGAEQRATIEFRAKGSDTWQSVKVARFDRTGRLDTKVKVEGPTARDGWYRVRFAGNGVSSAATSGTDFVRVR